MNNILLSLSDVSQANGFLFNMSLITVFGMIAGVKFNEYLIGFKRSITILIPFTFSVILTSALRIQETSAGHVIGSNAYNGSITILITSFFYMIGLFFGHVIFHKAHTQVIDNVDSQEIKNKLRGNQ